MHCCGRNRTPGQADIRCSLSSASLEILRRATGFLRRGQCGQGGDVRVALSSVERARRRLELEPLQQRYVLRMVRDAVRHGDWERLVRQVFNHAANLQIVLAIAVDSEGFRHAEAVNDVILRVAPFQVPLRFVPVTVATGSPVSKRLPER